MGIISFVIYIAIIYFFVAKAIKESGSSSTTSTVSGSIRSYFGNVEKVYSTSSLTIYRGDKSGDSFIIASKNSLNTITTLDLTTINEVATKHHIHNKILICNYTFDNTSPVGKKLREYDIKVWSALKLFKLVAQNNNDTVSTTSPLSTSDTLDDDCEIEEANDPIQSGTFNTHGIFSIFNDKPDRL